MGRRLNSHQTTGISHKPVMADEVVEFIVPRPGGVYLDATVGAGGHSLRLLKASEPDGMVIAFDRDERALAVAYENLAGFGGRVEFHHKDFRDAPAILDGLALDGMVADLGVSSMQLEDPDAGFSFRLPGPLDMRMDRSDGATAADLVNTLPREELADLIWRYGEERRSRRIAAAIVEARERSPITRVEELAAVVRNAFSAREIRQARIDPATRTFQALRIAVNEELRGLDRFIEEAAGLLKPGARMVVISFHSLEDRIVKQTLKRLSGGADVDRYRPPDELARPPLRLLTRRASRPSAAEVEQNPRSRSARLRVAERRTEEGPICAS
jgi:16S rRNA (cytosine1402-N4)-methyltransferase